MTRGPRTVELTDSSTTRLRRVADDRTVTPDSHAAAASFLATHGRVLDRRRLAVLLAGADRGSLLPGLLTALEAYRNPDGGYGWGLEPDLRSPDSQPAAAMHALEVLGEAVPVTTPHAVKLCDWLAAHTLPDGGLPLALPVANPAGCAPLWLHTDPSASSLQMTAQVAAGAQLLGQHQPAVADHPWLATATRYCLDAIRAIEARPHAYELMFALRFLDAVADRVPEGPDEIRRLGGHLRADGSMQVEGGAPDEVLRPFDLAPRPGRPSRELFSEEVITADLARLAGQQQPDGGWPVEFPSYSPAAAAEWRGYATVQAIAILRRHRG